LCFSKRNEFQAKDAFWGKRRGCQYVSKPVFPSQRSRLDRPDPAKSRGAKVEINISFDLRKEARSSKKSYNSFGPA
jgi:hypothetical protein